MSKIKTVVIGGAGFIGSHVADLLVERDYDVHVIDDLSNGKKKNVNKKAVLHVCDVRDKKTLTKILADTDTVFHLAALPRVQFSIENPTLTAEVNVLGTVNVLEISQKIGVRRVVYSASSSAYGNQAKLPLKENMTAHPLSPYGLQKYEGELYCKLFSEVYGLETISLRYFNVYGPRFDPNGAYALVVGKFLKQTKQGKPMTITGNGEQTRDFTHVNDVAMANILAMTSKKVGKGEVINIGAGNNCSINKLAKIIGGKIEYIPARIEPTNTLADNSLAKKLLVWVPSVSLEKGIKELMS